jgi:hypothetical protein
LGKTAIAIRLGILVLALSISVCAQLPHQTRETFKFQYSTFVPCANNGEGEIVDLSGTFTYMLIWNVNGAGAGWTAQGIEQFRQHVTGIGETTSVQYQGVGSSNLTFKLYSPDGQVSTQVQNLTLVGGGTNYKMHWNLNFAISPDGNLLIFSVDNFRVECN